MRKFFLLFIIVFATLYGGEPQVTADSGSLWKIPSEQACADGVELATRYIVDNCNKYGQFTYRKNIDQKKTYAYKYNLLRHCGAVYALGMAWDNKKSPDVAAAIDRACKFLFAQGFISPWPYAKGAVAIWDIPGKLKKKVLPGEPIVAKLGGAGLGVLAFMAQQRSNGRGLDTAQKLGLFILSMQRADGSFVCKVEAGNIEDTGMDSLYYPGEAMLGLMRLYQDDGDKKWLQAVAKGMSFLAASRKRSGEYPPDHWVLMASAELSKHLDELPDSPITREELVEHAQMICGGMLTEQQLNAEKPLEFGSYRAGGFTCPTAIRIEGMCGALEFITDEKLKAGVRASLDVAVNFLLRVQVKDGLVKGGFCRSMKELPLVMVDAASVNRRMGEIRIDYVQHALSGIDMYMRLSPIDGDE